MKTLIITAHPSSHGFTHAIAEAIKDERMKKGGEVEILDLYKTDIRQDFLKFENPQEMKNPDPTREAMQGKISWADELVFIHPLWWLSMPAIMKNFIDWNITSPFAYHYENGRRCPHLTGKRARLYITCDGSFYLYLMLGLPFIVNWVIGIFTFCGIQTDYFKVLRMMDLKRDEKKREIALTSIRKNSERRSLSLRLLNWLGHKCQ